MLVPQALEGVAAVALLYAARAALVRRRARSCSRALLLAVTPVAALMFRFDNPDALLVCLLVASALLPDARPRDRRARAGSLAGGALIGLAFLTKMMQAFLVLPAFALVYLIAAPDEPAPAAWSRCSPGGVAIVAQRGLVGRDRRALAGRLRGPSSTARRTTASST